MWFIFPQVAGLGDSAMSKRYAIGTMFEADAFFGHADLGGRYRRLVDAVWVQAIERGTTIRGLFSSPDDSKLVSSLTLFAGVARRLDLRDRPELETFLTQAEEILQAAYAQGLARCAITEQFVAT